MNNLHVKTGDNVMIISGKDKGHTGKVLQVSPSENKVIVEGQNMVTKHVKPRRQGEQAKRIVHIIDGEITEEGQEAGNEKEKEN